MKGEGVERNVREPESAVHGSAERRAEATPPVVNVDADADDWRHDEQHTPDEPGYGHGV